MSGGRGPNGAGDIRVVGGKRVKRCAGCKVDQELARFSAGCGPGGYHRHCRACCAAWRYTRFFTPAHARAS